MLEHLEAKDYPNDAARNAANTIAERAAELYKAETDRGFPISMRECVARAAYARIVGISACPAPVFGGDIYAIRGKTCATVGPFSHGFVTCYDNPLDRDMPCTPPPKTGGD